MCIDSWMTRTVPWCPRFRVEEGVVAIPAQGPAHPVPWRVTCSLSLGVMGWTGPPQAIRLWVNPPRSLGNWSHPLPFVSAWSAVDYSQRAAAALSSLDQLSAAWWSATGCALLLIQQKLTVSLDFRSTAGCLDCKVFKLERFSSVTWNISVKHPILNLN